MHSPEFKPTPDAYEDKEKLQQRVTGLWDKAIDSYYKVLMVRKKVRDYRLLDAVLQKYREEVIRLVVEDISTILKKYLTDDNIVSYLIHEVQYNKDIQKETQGFWRH